MTDSKNVDIRFPASATDVRRVAVAASSSQFNFADLTVPLPHVVRPAAVARNPQRFASSSAASAEHVSSHHAASSIAVASSAATASAPAPASAATRDRGDSSAGASIARRSAQLDAQMAELFDYIGIVACRSPHMLSALNREAAESTSSSSSSSLAASISSELSAFRCFGASPDDDESHLDVACGYHGVSFRWRGLICPHTIAQLLSACRCARAPAF